MKESELIVKWANMTKLFCNIMLYIFFQSTDLKKSLSSMQVCIEHFISSDNFYSLSLLWKEATSSYDRSLEYTSEWKWRENSKRKEECKFLLGFL